MNEVKETKICHARKQALEEGVFVVRHTCLAVVKPGAFPPGFTHLFAGGASMERPCIKRIYQVYKRQGEQSIFIGVGPDKVAIDEPTPEMEEFIRHLDGSRTRTELRQRFPEADEWLEALDSMNVLEDSTAVPDIDPYIAERWSRQINYFRLYDRPGWSAWDAQKKLSNARVVVVGTGAGGTTLLRFLNAVGIGTLEAVDFDTFHLDNLPTHTTLDEEDVGSHKTEALRRHLFRQNSRLNFIPHHRRVESVDELADLIAGADFFCSAFDRPRVEAARWSNRAALLTGVPSSSIGATDKGARCGPIVLPGKTACFECVGVVDQDFLRTNETAALMGTTVAMLASIMVQEIVKVITGCTESRILGRSLYINTDTLDFTFTQHERKSDCFCAHLEAQQIAAGTAG
jgi:molybdopterin/thiamine biosynthesis adenylyltransferase